MSKNKFIDTATIIRKQRLLSNMRPAFSPRASRLHGKLSGASVLEIARFKGEIKIGRPSIFSLNDRSQLKFEL